MRALDDDAGDGFEQRLFNSRIRVTTDNRGRRIGEEREDVSLCTAIVMF